MTDLLLHRNLSTVLLFSTTLDFHFIHYIWSSIEYREPQNSRRIMQHHKAWRSWMPLYKHCQTTLYNNIHTSTEVHMRKINDYLLRQTNFYSLFWTIRLLHIHTVFTGNCSSTSKTGQLTVAQSFEEKKTRLSYTGLTGTKTLQNTHLYRIEKQFLYINIYTLLVGWNSER